MAKILSPVGRPLPLYSSHNKEYLRDSCADDIG